MGLLNDFLNSAKEAVDEAKNVFNNRERNNNQTNHTPNLRFDCPPEALPPRLITTNIVCYRGNMYIDKECRFMISQDFIEDGGYESSISALRYCPEGFFNEDDFTISVHEGPGDFFEIHDLLEEFCQTGNISKADEFVKFEDGKYLFKAKHTTNRYKEYFYVVRDQYEDELEYRFLLLLYTEDIVNTKLEQKLISCFEDVVNSYEEIG